MLAVALEEARKGLAEGGIPIGAALFSNKGALLGRGHNRRIQENDPSVHGETAAFRNAALRRRIRSMSNSSRPIRPGRCMSGTVAARCSAMR